MSMTGPEQYDGPGRLGVDEPVGGSSRLTAEPFGAQRRPGLEPSGREAQWRRLQRSLTGSLTHSRLVPLSLLLVSAVCLAGRAAQIYRVFEPWQPNAPATDSSDSGPTSFAAMLGAFLSYQNTGPDPTPWAMLPLVVLVLLARPGSAVGFALLDTFTTRALRALAVAGGLAGAATVAVVVWWVATTGGIVSESGADVATTDPNVGILFYVDPVAALTSGLLPGLIGVLLAVVVLALLRASDGANHDPSSLLSADEAGSPGPRWGPDTRVSSRPATPTAPQSAPLIPTSGPTSRGASAEVTTGSPDEDAPTPAAPLDPATYRRPEAVSVPAARTAADEESGDDERVPASDLFRRPS